MWMVTNLEIGYQILVLGTSSYEIEEGIDGIYNAVLNSSLLLQCHGMYYQLQKTYTVNCIVVVNDDDDDDDDDDGGGGGEGCCYCFYLCHRCCHPNPSVADIFVIVIVIAIIIVTVVIIVIIIIIVVAVVVVVIAVAVSNSVIIIIIIIVVFVFLFLIRMTIFL